ncbi:MAG: hypothetical protein OEQ13_14305, partial [Acidobacteriota bacterium]|nr:hypothetical protein [Acidobacteriota bacterium]
MRVASVATLILAMSSRLAARARPEAHLVVPTALAALVRLSHLAFVAARDPLFLHAVADSYYHVHEARQILTEGWLLPGLGAFYKGPLYSYVLAILFAVFGETAGVVAGRLLSVALGCGSVFLVARIAERLSGKTAAWIAGVFAALYGTSV